MTMVIDVEVDAMGNVRPLEPSIKLPQGRAQLRWQEGPSEQDLMLAYSAFGEDWLRPEEDEAWARFKLDK